MFSVRLHIPLAYFHGGHGHETCPETALPHQVCNNPSFPFFFQDVSCGGALRHAKSAQRHQSRLMFEKRQGRGVFFVLFGFLRRRLPDNTVVYFFFDCPRDELSG